MEKKNIIVIGGGPAGMMAAGMAAKRYSNVTLIEQNKILGKKLLITGKGRCNITNGCEEVEELIRNVPQNAAFLYSAFYTFTNQDTIDFFNQLGLPTKIERGNRVFPVSDKSADVVNAMKKFLIDNHVEILKDRVDDIMAVENKIHSVILKERGELQADTVILATGGLSYPLTGSTGDGYTWAENLGHTITEIHPSLVPLKTEEEWPKELSGLSLKNIGITVYNSKNKPVYHDFGEMLFAHFGLTGPVILSASAHMRNLPQESYTLVLDLKPALDESQLDLRLQKDFQKYSNKSFKNSLKDLLPSALINFIIRLSGISPDKKTHSITRDERKNLGRLLKEITFHIKDFCDIERAIITSGGVSVKEINPSTMESKLVSGLYFAGEIIDVDAYTGGFNLQIAFSTGYLAGTNC